MFSYIRLSKKPEPQSRKGAETFLPSPSGEGLGGGAIVNNYQKRLDPLLKLLYI